MGPRVNSGNVVGMIKEESFNYEAVNLELPEVTQSKAAHPNSEVNTKEDRNRGVENQLPDKTCEYLDQAMPELRLLWRFYYWDSQLSDYRCVC